MPTQWIRVGGVAVILLGIASAGCQSEPAPQTQLATQPASEFNRASAHEHMMAGWKLTAAEARALEERVAAVPSDLAARTKLVSYYFNRAHGNKEARQARSTHALYIISHFPAEAIAGLPPVRFDSVLDGQASAEAKAQWLKQAERYSDSPAVLGNAAHFFLLSDPDRAETLLKQAITLEQSNPEWPRQLGHVHKTRMDQAQGEQRQEWAKKSLASFERAYELEPRTAALTDLAKTAFEAGDYDKAAIYAHKLLKEEKSGPGQWNYGNAIHDGNLVLGRIALRQGQIEEARKYLREAGKTPGSPQLNSFGPNLTLAKELLEKGEKQAVLEYFQAIRKFWKMGQDKLDQWTRAVEADGIPAFGANLDY